MISRLRDVGPAAMVQVVARPRIDLTSDDERHRLRAAFSVTRVRRGSPLTVYVDDTPVDEMVAHTLGVEAGRRAITLNIEGTPDAVYNWCRALAPTHRRQYLAGDQDGGA